MAAITAAMVKELRDKTGAGMSDCKNALVASDGDMEIAVEKIREKGLATAAKKSGRIATEGVVQTLISEDGKTAVICEINCETDFVGKNQEFRTFVMNVTKQTLQSNASEVEELLTEAWIADEALTVKDALTAIIARIGENITIRRFDKMKLTDVGCFATYIHGGGNMGVLAEISTEKIDDVVKESGYNICMQIAAMTPKYVTRDEISQTFISKEREILRAQAINEGKDEKVVDKMVEGRLTKNLKELCLYDQGYVRSEEGATVKKYLEDISKQVGSPVSIKRFLCYEKGEGLAKKEENFAEEVSKAMQQ